MGAFVVRERKEDKIRKPPLGGFFYIMILTGWAAWKTALIY
ncbi:hypothetical protein PROVRETT_09593 [Providencia rettgeri DSM 1131]|nr:hypothetical protein PROVRETT_09593 [Providencia rettgeri DSM 1131]